MENEDLSYASNDYGSGCGLISGDGFGDGYGCGYGDGSGFERGAGSGMGSGLGADFGNGQGYTDNYCYESGHSCDSSKG